MYKNALLITVLVATFVTTSAAQRIKQLKVDEAQLIETGSSNYALSDPHLLKKNGWASVSVNGDRISTWTNECQSNEQQELSEADKTLIQNEKAKLKRGLHGGTGATSYSSSSFSLDGTSSSSSSHSSGYGSGQTSSFSYNNAQVSFSGEDNFSLARSDLPDNLARVFVNDKLVTFVYSDGTVKMKPRACLDEKEQQLVSQLKQEVHELRKNMHKYQSDFNRNMNSMQQKLQQDMENMRYNLQQNFDNIPGPQQLFLPTPYRPYGQYQRYPWQMRPFSQSGLYPNNFIPFGGSSSLYGGGNPFGDSFPFGPQNNPFGPGFPFSR